MLDNVKRSSLFDVHIKDKGKKRFYNIWNWLIGVDKEFRSVKYEATKIQDN
jgi:hypothetical protein